MSNLYPNADDESNLDEAGGSTALERPPQRTGRGLHFEPALGGDSQDGGSAPVEFHRISTRAPAGIAKLIAAVLCGAAGALLLSEVENTAGLSTHLTLIGSCGVIAAVMLAIFAIRDFVGTLTVDGYGISMKPSALYNLQAAWSEIDAWQITEEGAIGPDLQQLRLWKQGESTPMLLELNWLSAQSREILRATLRRVAALKSRD